MDQAIQASIKVAKIYHKEKDLSENFYIPADRKLKLNETENLDEYQDFAEEIKKFLNINRESRTHHNKSDLDLLVKMNKTNRNSRKRN